MPDCSTLLSSLRKSEVTVSPGSRKVVNFHVLELQYGKLMRLVLVETASLGTEQVDGVLSQLDGLERGEVETGNQHVEVLGVIVLMEERPDGVLDGRLLTVAGEDDEESSMLAEDARFDTLIARRGKGVKHKVYYGQCNHGKENEVEYVNNEPHHAV